MESPTALTVGLTGGIASGKSTVGNIMADLGCFVTDADQLVQELYQPAEAGTQAVQEAFGVSYIDGEGAVDKQRLSELVFGDTKARRKLEQLIHPLVSMRFAQKTSERGGIVVFEATLLVEGGGYRNFNALVTVEADPELRIRRAVERGLSEPEARTRMAAQTSEEQRCRVADHVIRNEGTLDQLASETKNVVDQLNGLLEQSARDAD